MIDRAHTSKFSFLLVFVTPRKPEKKQSRRAGSATAKIACTGGGLLVGIEANWEKLLINLSVTWTLTLVSKRCTIARPRTVQ